MAQAKQGDTVKVHYTGKLEDGAVFDSSEGRDPLEFTIGAGNIIPGFEEGVLGMAPGETKTLNIPSDKAYGPHRQEMQVAVDKSQLPPDMELQEGVQLQMMRSDGMPVLVTVAEITDETVTLDANHPLAGKDLIFEVELVAIKQSM